MQEAFMYVSAAFACSCPAFLLQIKFLYLTLIFSVTTPSLP